MRRLFFIIVIFPVLILIGAACSDNPAEPQPSPVTASVTAPAQAYTGDDVGFSASCSSDDGLQEVVLDFESSDSEKSFTRTESPSGKSFSETVTSSSDSEGVSSLEIICRSTQGEQNSASASTTLRNFVTGLSFELRNAATGELQEGYVLAGGDSLYTSSGIVDVELTNRDIDSVTSGLIVDSRAGSYLRKTPVVAGAQNSSDLYHVDFLFRDVRDGSVIGELSRDGYDYDGPMDITRFLMHLDDNILVDGIVPRWKDFVPEKIVFADSISSQEFDFTFYFQNKEEADLLFETYKQQHKDITQPHLISEVPFERVDHFVYNQRADVDNIILISPDPTLKDRNRLGGISHFRDESGHNVGSYITVRDVWPDKKTNTVNYDMVLRRLFLHESYSAHINDGRSSDNIRNDESILPSSPDLLDDISPVDSKVLYELSQNPLIGDSEKKREYLILPAGF